MTAASARSLDLLWLPRYDESGASSRLRVFQVVPELDRLGCRSHIEPLSSFPVRPVDLALGTSRRVRRLNGRPPAVDAVVVQKEPFVPPGAGRWIPRRTLRSVPVVWDLDDAVWIGSDGRRAAFKRFVEVVDVVVAGSSATARFAAGHGVQTLVVPTTYVPVEPAGEPPTDAEPDRRRLGWIGSVATSAYLEPMGDVIAQVLDDDPGTEFVVMGGELPTAVRRHPRARTMPWSRSTESAFLDSLSVGLAPLSGDEWSEYKSGYKLIQYLCHGVPAVVSRAAAHDDIARFGSVSAASTPDEWYAGLSTRLRAPVAPASRADAAAAATAHFAPAAAARLWYDMLVNLVESGGGNR